jgi:hypothetical protein
MAETLKNAEAVVLGTRGIPSEVPQEHLHPDQAIVDLVNLEKDQRPSARQYLGTCW